MDNSLAVFKIINCSWFFNLIFIYFRGIAKRYLFCESLSEYWQPSGKFFFYRTYRLFLNTVHCYNLLEDYCYYEIQIHKALCEFAVEKGYCWLKEASPPYT
jgi:hypothetical protein